MLSRGFARDIFEEQNKFMRAMTKHFDEELQQLSKIIINDEKKTKKDLETENFFSKEVHSKTILDKDGKPITVEQIIHEAKKIDKDGNTIQNFKEVYKNAEKGIERISETRRIGDKVYKTHSEKIGKQTNVKTEMENLNQNEIEKFEKEWKKKGICCEKDLLGFNKALE